MAQPSYRVNTKIRLNTVNQKSIHLSGAPVHNVHMFFLFSKFYMKEYDAYLSDEGNQLIEM